MEKKKGVKAPEKIVENLRRNLELLESEHQGIIMEFRREMGLDSRNKPYRKELKGRFFVFEQPFKMTAQERLYNMFYWTNRLVKNPEVDSWIKAQQSSGLSEDHTPVSSNIFLAYFAMEPKKIPKIQSFAQGLQKTAFESVKQGNSFEDVVRTLEKFDFTFPFIGEPL